MCVINEKMHMEFSIIGGVEISTSLRGNST